MIGEAAVSSLSDRLQSYSDESPMEKLTLVCILCLSAFLTLYRVSAEGYANVYYAAAVKNMLTGWHEFFFVSFDAGFVTVDKPPLGLWIQAASAWLFGFHGWSLILPQAIACVLSVALLYRLVGRTFGSHAGLIAALTLAVTPVVVPTSRNNTADMLVVLAVLVGAWFVLRAAETGRRRWLLGCMVAVGLGFNIKMMEAYLVLPAFYLVYLLGAEVSIRRRLTDLGLATVVLAVVSFAWATVVALTPASQRPYVGSTDDNSIFSLIFGYNGVERLTGMGGGGIGGGGGGSGGMGGGGGFSHGAIGPLRLFNGELAGQIGWLLPIAVVTLALIAYRNRNRWPLAGRGRSLTLWGMWFLTAATFFSVAGFFHLYYLVMLAPPVAALVGIGIVTMWEDYWEDDPRGWLLPATLLGTAGVQAYILADYPSYSSTLTPLVVGGTLLVAAALVVGRVRRTSDHGRRPVMRTATVLGLLVLLVAPTTWGAMSITSGTNVAIPSAGPSTGMFGGGQIGGGSPPAGFNGSVAPTANGTTGSSRAQMPTNASANPGRGRFGSQSEIGDSESNSALLSYLKAHQGDATYLVAADSGANSIAPLMLRTDEPIISLGGFSGGDPVMDVDELASLVRSGDLRYVLVGGGMGGGTTGTAPSGADGTYGNQTAPSSPDSGGNAGSGQGGFGGNQGSETTDWVQSNCRIVSSDQWQPSDTDGSAGTGTLYNCTAAVGN
ncbi:glycosyltransferase family 39 protein [Haladaptatus sp. DYF46]|uniref:ArnT family glycosyltransferase n=1 Tax=Haladaptatus sp. DYF46 TaxID=2886041 RepID=UPI001E45A94C|nr:glycosyltransferase family 39 protein [Haladaptatus sp. DYF46]